MFTIPKKRRLKNGMDIWPAWIHHKKSLISICLASTIACLSAGASPSLDAQRNPQKANLRILLESLPGCSVEKISAESFFSEGYQLMLTQPLDHMNPQAGSFRQRILLFHVDFNKPVVLTTEGYALRKNWTRELAELTGANEIRVEHRFFGESAPDSRDWKYLHFKQAAADHHRIVTLMKPFYPGKWINTGLSKGGKTAMIHRWLYPDDVDVTVSYDGPLNLALEDPRIDDFFDKVGTQEQRQRLIAFQRLVLKNKKDILPRFQWYSKGKGYSFSVGPEKALEYLTLEYPFSFWQYSAGDFSLVPGEGATPDEILGHLLEIVSASAYADQAMDSPALYQAVTQFGYYGYVKKNVKDLLSDTEYSNAAFAPRNTDLAYDPRPMHIMHDWIKNHGERMLFIYGGNDPWSAAGVDLSGKADSLKMILKGGNHFTFINSFSGEQRERILLTLERWLDIKLER